MKIICAAGFFWHFVAARFEKDVNDLLDKGWTLNSLDFHNGFRLLLVAKLSQPMPEDSGPKGMTGGSKFVPKTKTMPE